MNDTHRPYQRCTNCVMDTSDSAITFDEHGVCDFCNDFYQNIQPSWQDKLKDPDLLRRTAEQIKAASKGRKYDCIIGMSGGVDSSYLCYVAKELMGLNPLVYSVDTGWNLNVAVENIERIVKALDLDMYLRIAPELYLKRLVVGGFERVFEINRNFRNEGIDARHNPEFTMMEFYATYWTYKDQMEFTEALLRHVAREVTGSAIVTYQGMTINFEEPFDKLTPKQAILKYSPEYSESQLMDEDFLKKELKRLGADEQIDPTLGSLQMALFDETVEKKLIKPTFIIDYPTEISPLARASDVNPDITERFELFIAGRETANGFSELNDPDDQAARFRAQVERKGHGDDEAMYYDADYVTALEYGLPPTAGCGIGIDRFMMLLTDAPTIRDVLLFPALRPESKN